MKVILIQDIPKIGKRDEVKEFADGYAQNVLLAKGLAVRATPVELDKLKKREKERTEKKENQDKEFDSILESVANANIVIKARANPKGSLFKAVTEKDIANTLSVYLKKGISIDTIQPVHIKELGAHNIKLKNGKKEGMCKIIIESEK